MRLTPWRINAAAFLLAHLALALLTSPLTAATLAIVETAILAWSFVVIYAVRAPWFRSEIGILIMSLGLFLALLASLSLIPDDLGFDGSLAEWVSFAVLTGMALLTMNMLRLLVWLPRRR